MSYDSSMAPGQSWEPIASRAHLAFYEPLAPRAVPIPREMHEVWEYNLDVEFNMLLAAVARAGGSEAILALDTEFPGFPCEDPQFSSTHAHYQALRQNVDQLWPIQLGVAVVSASGVHCGVWTFNLQFDARVDTHTEESLTFLREAGLDFPRLRRDGVSALALGQRLGNSRLVGLTAPCWVTFAGSYDWGYLLKLVTMGRALPVTTIAFDKVLEVYCPKRRELRDSLPSGSLETLGRRHGIERWGAAHTAGSDALLTLELFMLMGWPKMEQQLSSKVWSDMTWPSAEEWYAGSQDQWYQSDMMSGLNAADDQVAFAAWEAPWVPQNQIQTEKVWGDNSSDNSWNQRYDTNDWLSLSVTPPNTSGWYTSGLQPTSPTWYAAL